MSYFYPVVEEIHQPIYATAARGVGPVALGSEDSGERALITGVAVMFFVGIAMLALTHSSRGEGFLMFNPFNER